jgi:GPN-loop GTPase
MSSSADPSASSSASAPPPSTDPNADSNAAKGKKKPIVIITIGMAGSGKTTFVQRLNAHLSAQSQTQTHGEKTGGESRRPPYILNLDPAVANTPYEANIDIRDTVNYKEVMKQCAIFLSPCLSLRRLEG